jgi:hypothetical protein
VLLAGNTDYRKTNRKETTDVYLPHPTHSAVRGTVFAHIVFGKTAGCISMGDIRVIILPFNS